MASMNLFIKPYQAKQAIAKLGDQMTLEDYEAIQDIDFEDVSEGDESFAIIDRYIDPNDVFDSESEFTDVRVSLA